MGTGSRRHHAVPVGYQKAWQRHGRVLLVDKATLCGRPVSSKDAFVSKDLFTIPTEDGTLDLSLEEHFARLENIAIPGVRRYIAGAADQDAENAVKLLMATAFARGKAIATHSERFLRTEKSGLFDELLGDPKLVPMFRRDYGRDPTVEELTALLEASWESTVGSNRMYVDTVARAHNFAIEKFPHSHLQRIVAPRSTTIGFLSGDTPLVHADTEAGLRVGIPHGLALGEAGVVYYPLSPRVAVCLNQEPDSVVDATLAHVQWINRTFIERAAHRWLLAAPGMDVHRCLARQRDH